MYPSVNKYGQKSDICAPLFKHRGALLHLDDHFFFILVAHGKIYKIFNKKNENVDWFA